MSDHHHHRLEAVDPVLPQPDMNSGIYEPKTALQQACSYLGVSYYHALYGHLPSSDLVQAIARKLQAIEGNTRRAIHHCGIDYDGS